MVKKRFSTQLWISSGILVGSVVIAAVALQLIAGKMSADVDAITADRAAAESQTNLLGELTALEAGAPSAARYETAMNQLLPDQYGLVTFPQWLSQLGSKYGVTTDAAFQGSVNLPSGSTAGTAQFSFSAQGSPQNLAAFLADMNTTSSGFLIELTSFGVTNTGSSENMTGQGTLFFR